MHERYCIVIEKEIVTESFALTDMSSVTSSVFKAAVSTPLNALNIVLVGMPQLDYSSMLHVNARVPLKVSNSS